MLCYAMFFVTPKYKSSVQLLVTRNENIERQSYQNETKTNIDMIPTYKEIVMSEPVLEKVKETTGEQVGVAQLKKI
ncbi:Capsular polysaccharide biosynthesis protein [Streptococcus hyointestinalis]|uniref:Capsular polysaccharide biosynthesis protein n=2 Tax=Streptococcus hyointestinalis TaxID=1337 RepID=A0A380KBL7_9STRE|nr:Capsular polysaccharide biosynthesis protein [Streptococcus hyointestinalis]